MNMRIRKFLHEEDGVTALEYGILAAVVAIVIAATFAPKLKDIFGTLFQKMKDEVNSVT